LVGGEVRKWRALVISWWGGEEVESSCDWLMGR